MGCIFSSCRKKKPATKGSPRNRPSFPHASLPKPIKANDDDQSQKVTEPLKASDKLCPKELKREESVLVISPHPRSSELAASGWPQWLISEASEALFGWVPSRESDFEKQELIGGGTFSKVYKAKDIIRNKTVALKRIRFDVCDSESIKCIAREIIILRKLDHPNVIKLEGLMLVDRDSSTLYLIFEYMEHDLLRLSSLLGSKFSEPQVKCYMKQLLQGLDHCHTNHVLHRDIKSSNLLINSNGVLKIADFGLSTFFDPYNTVPLTTNVVTLWYRPPELLLGASHYGVGVDLWSTGCIIGELYAGKPILPGKNEREQLHKIFELCGSPSEDYWTKLKLQLPVPLRTMFTYGSNIAERFKEFPASVVSLLETLLSIDPDLRGTAASALDSEYFTTEPLPCDPSSLPKYPRSNETRKEAQQIRETDEPRDVLPNLPDSYYKEDGTSSSQDHSTKHMETTKEEMITEDDETGGEDNTSSSQDHSARQMQTAKDMTTEEDETSSSRDHCAREMQTSKDMTTEEDETGADSSREDQNLGEEHIPWPMTPSRVNSTTIQPKDYENGTFSLEETEKTDSNIKQNSN